MSRDVIGREEILAVIAIRAADLCTLERTMASTGDHFVLERLDARIDELNRIAGVVVQWGVEAPTRKGDGDGE